MPRRVSLPASIDVAQLSALVGDALDGGTRLEVGDLAAALPARAAGPDAALVLGTSGSTTGTPSLVALSGASIRASALATHDALGGPGAWLLTLSPLHVAGLMVVARARLAGLAVVSAATTEFRPATFVEDVARLLAAADGARTYTSLVPTQLRRVLADPAATAAAARLDAILVGGAATPAALLEQARSAGIPVVTTYGMTETAGGCVYDGVPLAGVSVRVSGPGAAPDGTGHGTGRIHLRGPQVALGYVTPSGLTAFDGEFATSDRGTWDGATLRVAGRLDDVILTGGVNVDPAQVEAAGGRASGVAEIAVVGIGDPEWGEIVVAFVVPSSPEALAPGPVHDDVADAVRTAVRSALGPAWVPRRVELLAELPRRGPGKVDRSALRASTTPAAN